MADWLSSERETTAEEAETARRNYETFLASITQQAERDRAALSMLPAGITHHAERNQTAVNMLPESRSVLASAPETEQESQSIDDDVEATLRIVRQRIRAARLADESKIACEHTNQYGMHVAGGLLVAAADAALEAGGDMPPSLSDAFPVRQDSSLDSRSIREELASRSVHWRDSSPLHESNDTPRTTGRRTMATLQDFDNQSLGDLLSSASRDAQGNGGSNPINFSRRWDRVSPSRRSRTGRQRASASDFGGSLGDILPARSARGRLRATTTTMTTNTSTVATASHARSDFPVADSPRSTEAGAVRDFMPDAELTYERLISLDDALIPRRLAVAENQQKSPQSLFRSLRTATYRSVRKSKARRARAVNGEPSHQEGEEECAICLVEFEHRQSVKRWPCGHEFHVKCTQELLNFDTRCPLCRYNLTTGQHD